MKKTILLTVVLLLFCSNFPHAAELSPHMQTLTRTEQEITKPISEDEYRNAIGNVESNIIAKKKELEEWFRLNASSPSGDVLIKLLPDKNSRFHGLSWGMSMDQVKSVEATRIDTILSPIPSLRPDVLLSYWYYIEEGTVLSLNYHFDSSGKLFNITLTFLDPPMSEADLKPIITALVTAFTSSLGTPVKKYSDYAYEWPTDAFKCFMLAFPSKEPPVFILYSSPDAAHNVNVNSLRESWVNSGEFKMIDNLP